MHLIGRIRKSGESYFGVDLKDEKSLFVSFLSYCKLVLSADHLLRRKLIHFGSVNGKEMQTY